MLNYKKLLIISIFFITLSLLLMAHSYASTGTVTGGPVRLRKEANTESEILTNAYKDNKVEILEESGDWYKVTFEGKTGYMHKDYVTKDVTSTDATEIIIDENGTPMEEDDGENEAAIKEFPDPLAYTNTTSTDKTIEIPVNTETTTKKETTVYITPLIFSSKIDKLAVGKKVTALETLNGWIKVSYDGKMAWIRIDSLVEADIKEPEVETEKSEETKETEKEEDKKVEAPAKQTVGYVNGSTVNVRKEPNTSSTILTQLDWKTKVDIISTENGWHKVKVDNMTGYISEALLVYKLEDVVARSGDTVNRTTETATSVEPQNTEISVGPATSKGQEIVEYAKTFLGTKYVSGGNGPNSFDCSGYTCYIFKKFGVTLPRASSSQGSVGVAIAKSDLQLGDLVIFNDDANKKIGHVGIFVGNNSFIHASNPSDGVKITSLSTSYYLERYVGARRVI